MGVSSRVRVRVRVRVIVSFGGREWRRGLRLGLGFSLGLGKV